MYNKKTLTFTFHHYWGAFCQEAFVLDPFILCKFFLVYRFKQQIREKMEEILPPFETLLVI